MSKEVILNSLDDIKSIIRNMLETSGNQSQRLDNIEASVSVVDNRYHVVNIHAQQNMEEMKERVEDIELKISNILQQLEGINEFLSDTMEES
tara:strand:- start:1395 stop:1670 length:276 start_codon:yes stop_codon:yes gene_type:complete